MKSFEGTDRFVHRRCLGTGSFGSVHEVYDRKRQASVALKTPHETTASSLFLFKREFRTLAEVHHPNLVNLQELIVDGNHWCFTMELIEGTDILHFLRGSLGPGSGPGTGSGPGSAPEVQLARSRDVRPQDLPTAPDALEADDEDEDELPPVSAPPDIRLVTRTFKQLAQGLQALHQAGLLHQDIKPSNVLVTAKGRVVLLDFGLTSEIDPPGVPPEGVSGATGTPAYMAPEQLLDHACSEAGDWYSVGVLLYQVLTGRLPFQGTGLRTLVNKVSQTPEAPSELVHGIPRGISDLCMDLLRPHPEERPGGADFLVRLEQSESIPIPARFPPGRRFVGRAAELDQLLHSLQAVQSGTPGWVHLHGGPGLGKTLLLQMFRREAQKVFPRALILSSRCYEQEDIPYEALDGLVDALGLHLRSIPPARIEAYLPAHIQALAHIFPVLHQIPRLAEFEKRPTGLADPQTLRRRAFGALRELLRRCGERQPLVLIVDDLHWGDPDSLTLLADILSPPDPPLLLFVACFRTEEGSTSPPLQDFLALGRATPERCLELQLEELSLDLSRQLAQELLQQAGAPPEDLVQWIARESGGNPFFIQELVLHARGQAHIARTREHLDSRIHSRIEALPAEAQRILRLSAIAGHPLEWGLLRRAAGVKGSGLDSLDALRQAHLVRTRNADQRRMVEPYHDLVRKAVLARLSSGEDRQGHLRLAQAFEVAPQLDVQALALHFTLAGETGKAINYLTTAGLEAAASLAFGRAASLFRLSLDIRALDDPAPPALWGHLGDALANAGRGREAAEAYLKGVRLASPEEAIRFRRQAAQEYLRNGHFKEGVAVLDEVLSAVGTRLIRSRTLAILSALFHRTLLRFRGTRVKERDPDEIPPAALEKLDIYWVATMGLAAGDIVRAADYQARQLLLNLRTGEPSRLIRALAYEAIFSSALGRRGEPATQAFLRLTLQHAERLGGHRAECLALLAQGFAQMNLGHWRKSADTFGRVETMLAEDSTSLAYELRSAQAFGLMNCYPLGNLRRIAEQLPALCRDAEETGDLLFLANLKTGAAFIHHLARNAPGFARQDIHQTLEKLSPEGFFHQRYLELIALGNIDLYEGNLRTGWQDFTRRWEALRPSGLLMAQVVRITCLELRARMALAVSFTSQDPAERKRLQSRAHRDGKALRWEGVPYGMGLVHRLDAIKAWHAGQRAEALGHALLAETAFDACDMALHANVMKRFRGLHRSDPGRGLLLEAEAWMREQGIVDPARMTAMFLPGMAPEEGAAPMS